MAALLSDTRSPSDARDADQSAGSLRPGHRLATGRAALGGVLVALAALGVFATWNRASQPPTTSWVVARADLASGTVLTRDHLTTVAIDLPGEVAGTVVDDPAALVGSITVAPLAAGDLVRRSAVVEAGVAPDPGHEVALTLERARAVGGGLAPGEAVAVMATYGTGPDAWTEVLVRGAVVVEVAEASDGGLAASGQVVVTLVLPTERDVVEAVHAHDAGVVTLVRSTRAGPGGGDEQVDVHRPTPPPAEAAASAVAAGTDEADEAGS